MIHPITKAFTALLKKTCAYPDKLYITETVAENQLSIQVQPDAADYGRIAGREGRQIFALTFLVKIAGSQSMINAGLKLIDPIGGRRESRPFVRRDDFEVQTMLSVVSGIVEVCFPSPHPEITTAEIDGRQHVYINTSSDNEIIRKAINDVMWPYGKNNGREIEVKIGRIAVQHTRTR